MPSVLVVEDDPSIRQSLIEVLTEHGYAVRSAGDGFGALREVTQSPVDAVVLDLGLPDLDGGDALRMIRGISSVPVLVATARDDEAEIIRLLNAGADDYLVKPFSGGQLIARLSAVLRRTSHLPPAHAAHGARGQLPAAAEPLRPTTVGELAVDPGARTAYLSGRELRLTRREFDLLAFLAHHTGQVVSKRRLLTEVWREPYVDDQTVDVHLSSLRRKLGERGRPALPADRPRRRHQAGGAAVRRSLAGVALAVTSMVALSFLIPLAALVMSLVKEQSVTAAEQRAAALAPVLTLTTDPSALRESAASLDAAEYVVVHLPEAPPSARPGPRGAARTRPAGPRVHIRTDPRRLDLPAAGGTARRPGRRHRELRPRTGADPRGHGLLGGHAPPRRRTGRRLRPGRRPPRRQGRPVLQEARPRLPGPGPGQSGRPRGPHGAQGTA